MGSPIKTEKLPVHSFYKLFCMAGLLQFSAFFLLSEINRTGVPYSNIDVKKMQI